jgi:predicted TIM-barrel fold metal-dependent hydrolase
MARSRFGWLKRLRKSTPEPPERPPIWLGSHSNGEYFHEQTPRERAIERLVLDKADELARRLGIERREFLASAMGMATTLWAINVLSGCESSDEGGGGGSGNYCLPPEAMVDEQAACAALDGTEFIFDIQTHHFDPDAEWVQKNSTYLLIIQDCGMASKADCVSRDEYMRLLFCESQTTMAALSTWPAALCTETRTTACGLPLPNEEVAKSRDAINLAAHSQRIVNHCQIMPNDPFGLEKQLAIMEEIACGHGAFAWKCYPAWGPEANTGFFLDDPLLGIPFIEKGLELGVKLFCVHKGLPIPGFDVPHNHPEDIGRVAKRYPEAQFIVYHSAICTGQSLFCNANEGPYDPANATEGTNTLIKSMEDNGIGPNQNVYAELGSAFSQVRNDATMAAHFIGKLLKYVGENNVLWGTDAILFGSPQGLIESFRALTIPQQMQEQYGYPELTAELKAKILGLNAAKVYGVDPALKRCQLEQCSTTTLRRELDGELGGRRWTMIDPLGPRTRREFFALARKNRALGRPG